MTKKYKRILILTPLALLSYFTLVSVVVTYNMRFALLIIVFGFVALVTICDGKIKQMFLNAYNRFAYFTIFFLVLHLSNWSRFSSMKRQIQEGYGVNTFALARANFHDSATRVLFSVFLIVYAVSRLRTYLHNRKLEDRRTFGFVRFLSSTIVCFLSKPLRTIKLRLKFSHKTADEKNKKKTVDKKYIVSYISIVDKTITTPSLSFSTAGL